MERKIHKIDANGKAVGRIASEIALLLRGKNKPEYEPHLDMGDAVEVTNIEKIRITGRKLEDKEYHNHSGYPGGLRTRKMKDLMTKNPKEVLEKAVYNMLPANKLRANMKKRLIIK